MSIQALRNRAYILGYAIYYPSHYCDEASIYPLWPWASSNESFEIDTSKTLDGHKIISAVLDRIAALEPRKDETE